MQGFNVKKNISFKTIFAVLGIGTAALLGLRIYQLFRLTELDGSGFFKRVNPTVYIVYALAVLFAALIIILVTASNKVTASKSFRGKNKFLAIGATAMSVGLAWDVAVCLSSVIKAVSSFTPGGTQLIGYLASNGMIAAFFEALFGLAACIYFILYALSYNEGKASYYEYKLLAITPLFWVVFRLVRRFLTKISFIVVADLMFELAMLGFMLLFFLSFARISAQLCQKNEMRRAMKYGLAAAMFAAVIAISRLVAIIGGKADALADGFTFNIADAAFAVFAVFYVDASSKTGRPAEEDDIIEDEEEEEGEENEIDESFLDD